MVVPGASHSAEIEGAALQAEFNEKKWVWVPDEREGYLKGWVNREDGDVGEIVMDPGGEVSLSSQRRKLQSTNHTILRFGGSHCTLSRR